jgi:hypothetical protein
LKKNSNSPYKYIRLLNVISSILWLKNSFNRAVRHRAT